MAARNGKPKAMRDDVWYEDRVGPKRGRWQVLGLLKDSIFLHQVGSPVRNVPPRAFYKMFSPVTLIPRTVDEKLLAYIRILFKTIREMEDVTSSSLECALLRDAVKHEINQYGNVSGANPRMKRLAELVAGADDL